MSGIVLSKWKAHGIIVLTYEVYKTSYTSRLFVDVLVSFRRDMPLNFVHEFFFEMGVRKVEQLSGQLALRAMKQGQEKHLKDSETCSAFKVFFSSSEAGLCILFLTIF